mmetsp:Transcript_16732/g.54507  ORF Transcript_16732/g.54507 Transcript_16732/m.54507 type:complete len:293 (-) Transcript_16732:217-1095(-)
MRLQHVLLSSVERQRLRLAERAEHLAQLRLLHLGQRRVDKTVPDEEALRAADAPADHLVAHVLEGVRVLLQVGAVLPRAAKAVHASRALGRLRRPALRALRPGPLSPAGGPKRTLVVAARGPRAAAEGPRRLVIAAGLAARGHAALLLLLRLGVVGVRLGPVVSRDSLSEAAHRPHTAGSRRPVRALRLLRPLRRPLGRPLGRRREVRGEGRHRASGRRRGGGRGATCGRCHGLLGGAAAAAATTRARLARALAAVRRLLQRAAPVEARLVRRVPFRHRGARVGDVLAVLGA